MVSLSPGGRSPQHRKKLPVSHPSSRSSIFTVYVLGELGELEEHVDDQYRLLEPSRDGGNGAEGCALEVLLLLLLLLLAKPIALDDPELKEAG
ncbi:hypothetical protein VP1G_10765 [Cytospora mali]|uniref:Uncharacterized protein n=1 Tax=Cytospora mali TaxID=578113 RepID=A0A194UWN6_CYTMA|nr:hypothetical protein VP1G_10765 [Valsa mali var. pyri (nom. inval.)]